MSSIIFKNERVKKSEWYAWFLSKWVEAGWTDISSNPSTDDAVMYSEGEKGNKTLYLGFGGTIKNVTTIDTQTLNIRICRTYTPNVLYGVAGKFELPNTLSCLLVGDLNLDHVNHELNMWYYVNKSWGMFITEGHLVKGGNPSCIFVGQPDIELGPSDKTNIIVAASKIGNGTGIFSEHDRAYYSGNPYSNPTSYLNNIVRYVGWESYGIASANNNTTRQNTQFASTVVYGTNEIGYKFQLDDSILVTHSNNVAHTMNYNINGEVYRFFNVATSRNGYVNSFNNVCVGIRIK